MSRLAFINSTIDGILNELVVLESNAETEQERSQLRTTQTAIKSWTQRYIEQEQKGHRL